MTLGHHAVGGGPIKVLWAHSWLAGHEGYDGLFPLLDTERYSWVFPDFRGYGRSGELTGDFSVQEMGRDLIDLVDTLGWDEFHLVGHSMGGQAAQWVAGRPEPRSRPASLTLLSAVPSRGFPLDADGAALFGTATGDPEARATVISAVTGGRLGAGFVRHVNDVSHRTADPAAMRGYLRTWTGDDASGEALGYQGPVLVLTGRHDPVLTQAVAEGQIVPQYTDVRSVVIDGAAHLPPMETPARTAALIEGHVLESAAGTSERPLT
ncbi:alpha/beta fold hydrolase [Streptomyces sp. NPDC002574]|uniref:alpha/beta fold hydrolase n=1 Tax=Streptomyces sp. NPDC002574 TaxID=3364652 RepID=UPI003699C1FF